MNKKFLKLFGPSAIGKKCYEVYKIDKEKCENYPLKKPIKVGRTKTFEVSGILDHKTYQISSTGIKNPDGSLVLLNFFKDITEQAQIKSKLRAAETNYHSIFDNVSNIIAVHDAETGKPLDLNRAMVKKFGWTKKEFLLKNIEEWSYGKPPYSQKEGEIWVRKALKKPQKFEWLCRKKNGALFWAEVNLKKAVVNGKIVILAIVNDIDKQKKTLELLKESEEKFRTLIESSLECIKLFDVRGRLVYMNNSGLKEHRLKARQLSSWNYLSSIVPEDRYRTEQALSNALKGKISSLEIKHDLKYSSSEWCFISLIPIKNSLKEVVGVLAVSSDITQRKKAEDALRESESRLQAIFDNSAAGISIVSAEGRWLKANKALCRMVGYSEKEMLSKNFKDITFPEDVPKSLATLNKLLAGKANSFHFEKRYLCKKGRIIWTHLSGNLIRDPSGKPLYFVVVTNDVTLKKKAEIELQTYKEQLERLVRERTMQLEEKNLFLSNIINTSKDMIFVKDRNLRTILCNSAFSGSVDKKPLEMYGHTDIENGWDPELVKGSPQKGIRGFEKDDKEVLIGKKIYNHNDPANIKGEVRIFDTIRLPLRGERKKIIGVLGIARDITEIRKDEAQIKQQFEELKSLDVLKTEFLSAVSHELRTPLTPIESQLQRLLDKQLPREEQKESLEMAIRNTYRLDRLINEVLEISRIRSKRLNLVPQKTNLKELIATAVRTMATFAKEKGVTIITKTKPFWVKIDRDRILSVLINLLDNAIKFNGKDNVIISVKKSSREIIVSVKDHGVGIAEEDFPKIFTPFFRSERTYVYKGAGLGLSICKGIVEAHGGKIWFESKLGQGTVFHFSLPLQRSRKEKIEEGKEEEKREMPGQ